MSQKSILLFDLIPPELVEEITYKIPFYLLSDLQTIIPSLDTWLHEEFYWFRRATKGYHIDPELYLKHYLNLREDENLKHYLKLREDENPSYSDLYIETIADINGATGLRTIVDPSIYMFKTSGGIGSYVMQVALSGDIDILEKYIDPIQSTKNRVHENDLINFAIFSRTTHLPLGHLKDSLMLLTGALFQYDVSPITIEEVELELNLHKILSNIVDLSEDLSNSSKNVLSSVARTIRRHLVNRGGYLLNDEYFTLVEFAHIYLKDYPEYLREVIWELSKFDIQIGQSIAMMETSDMDAILKIYQFYKSIETPDGETYNPTTLNKFINSIITSNIEIGKYLLDMVPSSDLQQITWHSVYPLKNPQMSWPLIDKLIGRIHEENISKDTWDVEYTNHILGMFVIPYLEINETYLSNQIISKISSHLPGKDKQKILSSAISKEALKDLIEAFERAGVTITVSELYDV